MLRRVAMMMIDEKLTTPTLDLGLRMSDKHRLRGVHREGRTRACGCAK